MHSLILYTKIYSNSNPTAAIFLDLAEAFHRVNQKVLLRKLYTVGIRDPKLKIYTDYLKEKKQLVKIKETKNEIQNIEIGVSQGTILGPLVFIIYNNDIFEFQSQSSFIIFYADDTA